MTTSTAHDRTATPVADTGALLGLSTNQLETELLGLAGHIAAAQCRFLQLLAEFDRRGGWGGPGLRSCAHWLSWRVGMSLRTATEHVRVAHALAELPKITAAFAEGRISYSKVRAITRVTGPDSATGPSGFADGPVDATADRPAGVAYEPGDGDGDGDGDGPQQVAGADPDSTTDVPADLGSDPGPGHPTPSPSVRTPSRPCSTWHWVGPRATSRQRFEPRGAG